MFNYATPNERTERIDHFSFMIDAVLLESKEYMVVVDFNFDLLKPNTHWLEANDTNQSLTACYLLHKSLIYEIYSTTSTSTTLLTLLTSVYHLMVEATIFLLSSNGAKKVLQSQERFIKLLLLLQKFCCIRFSY